jgi:hypothetical protein
MENISIVDIFAIVSVFIVCFKAFFSKTNNKNEDNYTFGKGYMPEPPTSLPMLFSQKEPQKKVVSNCCSSCGSGIKQMDKTCTQCGAPNENYLEYKDLNEDDIDQKIFTNAFSDYVQKNIDKEMTYVRGGIDNALIYTYIHSGE